MCFGLRSAFGHIVRHHIHRATNHYCTVTVAQVHPWFCTRRTPRWLSGRDRYALITRSRSENYSDKMSIGFHAKLLLVMRAYSPPIIHCQPPAGFVPYSPACSDALDSMPFSKDAITFGPVHLPGTDITLPKEYSEGSMNLFMIVSKCPLIGFSSYTPMRDKC